MIIGTFIPDSGRSVELIRSGRDWVEHDFRVNNRPVISVVQFYETLFARGIYHGNMRNMLSFRTWRSLDDDRQVFQDSEGALLHMLFHGQELPVSGMFKLELNGSHTRATVWALNCLRESTEPFENVGITNGWQHTLNCGEFTKTNPRLVGVIA